MENKEVVEILKSLIVPNTSPIVKEEGVINEKLKLTIEETPDENPQIPKLDRSKINIQHFMDDMRLVGEQVRNPALRKPFFHYGDGAVTNYLLWLIYAELMLSGVYIK